MADTMIEEMRKGISYWFPSSKIAYILLALIGIISIIGVIYYLRSNKFKRT